MDTSDFKRLQLHK